MRFVDEHRDRFAVALLLRVLNIAESTYYQWIKQAEQPSDRDLVDLGLLSNIHEIWEASGFTYGADRVHRQLRRDGIRVGRKRIERLMAGQGWHGAFLRRGWRGGSTKQNPAHTPAYYIKVSAMPDGSFTITNQRNGFSKTYSKK